MSHITLAQQGLAAVEARHWERAVAKLSTALQTSMNPKWLIGRSRALAGLGKYQEALEDAELAWHSAYDRNKREEMAEAQYRRGVACRGLGRYADADACCIYAMRLIEGFAAVEAEDPAEIFVGEDGKYAATAEDAQAVARDAARLETLDKSKKLAEVAKRGREGGDNSAQTMLWQMACTLRVQALTDMARGGNGGRVLGVRTRPELKSLAMMEGVVGEGAGGEEKEEREEGEEVGSEAASEAGSEAAPGTVPETAPGTAPGAALGAAPGAPSGAAGEQQKAKKLGPLRFQEFQSKKVFWVLIFTKGVDREKLKVEFLQGEVRLNPVNYPGGEVGELNLQLGGEIIAEGSTFTVTPNKVELCMKKKTVLKAVHLAGATTAGGAEVEIEADKDSSNVAAPEIAQPCPREAQAPPMKAPAYPTSAKSGPKDWDKVGDDEEGEEGKDVNHFFKTLFKGATPEQQRAMVKSFTESNGTALSTDWNDVKDRTVETVPPDGVEAKKWE